MNVSQAAKLHACNLGLIADHAIFPFESPSGCVMAGDTVLRLPAGE
jgi:hypothetical protein